MQSVMTSDIASLHDTINVPIKNASNIFTKNSSKAPELPPSQQNKPIGTRYKQTETNIKLRLHRR